MTNRVISTFQGRYSGVYQASSRTSFVTFGGSSIVESLHCGMAEIFHSMLIFTHAFWPVGNVATRQDQFHPEGQAD